MNLKIATPIGVMVDTPIQKVDFESIDGFYTILPKHMDMVTALRASILSYQTDNKMHYVACNKGVLIKKGSQVSVSTSLVVIGDDLKALKEKISSDFKQIEEERKETNLALAKLELGLTKGLISLKNGEINGGI